MFVYSPDRLAPLAWRNMTTRPNSEVRADERSSVIAVTGHNGDVQRIHRYDEYGNENGAPHLGLFGFAGHFTLPGTGVVHMRARGYDTRTGRFVSTDPARFIDGSNLYVYAGGDPVNRIDPDGRLPIIVAGLAAIGSAVAKASPVIVATGKKVAAVTLTAKLKIAGVAGATTAGPSAAAGSSAAQSVT
jgi:RHS repeat-associated protein